MPADPTPDAIEAAVRAHDEAVAADPTSHEEFDTAPDFMRAALVAAEPFLREQIAHEVDEFLREPGREYGPYPAAADALVRYHVIREGEAPVSPVVPLTRLREWIDVGSGNAYWWPEGRRYVVNVDCLAALLDEYERTTDGD